MPKTYASPRLLNAIAESDVTVRELASKVGFKAPTQLSKIIHGASFGDTKKARVLKLAALLKVPAKQALTTKEDKAPKQVAAPKGGK